MEKKDKGNKLIKIIMLVISLVAVIAISMFLLDTTGKINQGNFRINDLAIISTVDVEDTKVENQDTATETSINNLSDLKLNITQKNAISFLIAKTDNAELTQIYIDNIKIIYPTLTQNMYIYQNEQNKVDLKTENIKLDLQKEDLDGQYLVKINIDNDNCLKEAAIPETQNSIVFDGTILSLLNTKISDITFNIEFNLNVVETNGRKNVCTVKLNLPNELLITNGVSIINENVGSFPFRIK